MGQRAIIAILKLKMIMGLNRVLGLRAPSYASPTLKTKLSTVFLFRTVSQTVLSLVLERHNEPDEFLLPGRMVNFYIKSLSFFFVMAIYHDQSLD